MTRMKESSSSITFSNEDDKNLEWLLEVFGSKISPDDMASAYCQAKGDLQKANEILCNMLGSSSNNNTHISTDDLTSPHASSLPSSYTSVGTVSGLNGAGYEPPRVLSRPKPRNSGVSMGTVAGRIGADYGRSRPLTKQVSEITKPVKLMSSEIPASQIWVEKSKPDHVKTETMNKDIELFLLKMLGDGFQLDMDVIKQVVGGCGYDVQESMEKLMNMSTPTLDLGNATSSMVDLDQTCEDLQDLEIKSQGKLQVIDSTGRSNLEREILGKLFTSKVGLRPRPTPTLPRREPRTRKYGVVTGPLEEPVTEFTTPIVIKEANGNGETEDNYETLREAAMEHWVTMKKYYRAAAEAYAKGDYELAKKFVKQGHFFMDKAKEANEMSGKMLTETRNDGEVISIDLNNYDPKEAIRLMKTQLKSMSGIPSIHYLKVKVGTSDDNTKPNARKRLICRLLERDEITWTEEENGQTMAIRIDVINPKRLSFNKK